MNDFLIDRLGADDDARPVNVELRPIKTTTNGGTDARGRRISFNVSEVKRLLGISKEQLPKQIFVKLHQRTDGREIAEGIANKNHNGMFYFAGVRIPDDCPLKSSDFYAVSIFEPVVETPEQAAQDAEAGSDESVEDG